MNLVPIPAHQIDAAWADGAHCLGKACETSGGEIEGPQLKMLLSRGERTLIRMDKYETFEHEGKELKSNKLKTVGWGVVRVDQLPNMRVLFITDLVAPHGHFEDFFTSIKDMAQQFGCSRVRCAAQPAQARLYRMRCDFKPVYQILEVLT